MLLEAADHSYCQETWSPFVSAAPLAPVPKVPQSAIRFSSVAQRPLHPAVCFKKCRKGVALVPKFAEPALTVVPRWCMHGAASRRKCRSGRPFYADCSSEWNANADYTSHWRRWESRTIRRRFQLQDTRYVSFWTHVVNAIAFKS